MVETAGATPTKPTGSHCASSVIWGLSPCTHTFEQEGTMTDLQVNDSSPEEGKTLTVIFKHSLWPSDAWEVKGDAHSQEIPPGTRCALHLQCSRAPHFIPTGSQCNATAASVLHLPLLSSHHPWRDSEAVWMWHVGTWVSGGLGSAGEWLDWMSSGLFQP